ncbi:MAG: hypothetical protein GXP49_14420 [Deltaproteobacteria bacterium]|nr:hypothetical protein [Deltaproteobacteria bacterium]
MRKKRIHTYIIEGMRFITFCFLAASIPGMALGATTSQPLTKSIAYKGVLEKDGVVVTGQHSITFELYANKGECTSRESAQWTTTRTIDFTAGRFNVVLGGGDDASQIPESLLRSSAIYLAISVDGVPLSGCQVVVPTAYSLRSVGDVPIGTIINWWRPDDTVDIPEGYQICDGSEITDDRSPFKGSTVPNLVGRFIRGVGSPSEIGQTGGSDDLPDYDVHVDPPPYDINWETNSAGSHNHAWSFFTSGENWYTYKSDGGGQKIMDWGDGIGNDGSGIYPFAHDGSVSSTRTYYTRNSGSHKHTIEATLDLPGFDTTGTPSGGAAGKNVPSYIGLLKLIRIF